MILVNILGVSACLLAIAIVVALAWPTRCKCGHTETQHHENGQAFCHHCKCDSFERRPAIKRTDIFNCERSLYLTRWHLFRTEPFAIFLHLFHRSDEDRALHDHPWTFVSVILWRGYVEHSERKIKTPLADYLFDTTCHTVMVKKRKWPGMILVRRAEWKHRVELIGGKKALTLIFRFKRRREWGYHFPKGWVHNSQWWKENCE